MRGRKWGSIRAERASAAGGETRTVGVVQGRRDDSASRGVGCSRHDARHCACGARVCVQGGPGLHFPTRRNALEAIQSSPHGVLDEKSAAAPDASQRHRGNFMVRDSSFFILRLFAHTNPARPRQGDVIPPFLSPEKRWWPRTTRILYARSSVEPWLPSPPPSRSPRRRPSPAARFPREQAWCVRSLVASPTFPVIRARLTGNRDSTSRENPIRSGSWR